MARPNENEFPEWQRAIVPLIVSPDNIYAGQALGGLTIDDQEQAIAKVDPTAVIVAHNAISLKQPCQLWSNMTILVDGTIMECCNWYNPAKHNYGNIKDYIANGYDLHDAWMMRLANKFNNSVCQACAMRRSDAKLKLDKIRVKADVAF
jgi:radical SAM protein with 4Fe4S-binding SPASM domain